MLRNSMAAKALFILLIAIATMQCTQDRTIRVAAIQLHVKVGEGEANLKNTEEYIRKAFEGDAELVLIPELFTTPGFGFPFHQEVVNDIEPLEGRSLRLLRSLAKEYDGIIGGSFLAFDGEDVHNSFVLVFPDGKYFLHNKDYPTYHENCFYTGGDDDGVFDTKIGTIGVALCWEYLRTETAQRLFDKVDLVIGGSCWPDSKDPEQTNDKYLLELLQNAPSTFASHLGVPVVHTNHVGMIAENYTWQGEEKEFTQYYLGEAQIVDGYGQIIDNLSYGDGEGIIWGDITLGKVTAETPPIPDRFWIPDFTQEQHDSWEAELTGPCRDFYEDVTLPYVLEMQKR